MVPEVAPEAVEVALEVASPVVEVAQEVASPVVEVVPEVAEVAPEVVLEAVPEVVLEVEEAVPEVVLLVQRVVTRLSSNHTSSVVFSLPEVRKICWSPRTWPQVNPFTVKREYLLKNQAKKKVFQPPRLNTESGILSDPSWLPVSWVV